MIAFGGRRGPHRSGSRCRGRPIERREAGREGCLWPNAASQGRPPDGSGGETERALHSKRPREDLVVVVVVVVVVVRHQLRITSGRLPRIWGSMVRAAQASPDHGFCGFRAERTGDTVSIRLAGRGRSRMIDHHGVV